MARTRFGPGAGDEDTLQDADNDTKVTVEENTDEDKIRFSTAGIERMIVDAGGFVGIGTSVPTEILTLNAASQGEPTISFKEEDTEMGIIGINASQNILIENKTSNKHIVFKASDAGVSREGLRLDGAVPEVVVNQTSDSLVDFRVESDNNTHMLYVDGGNNRVGINESAPQAELHVNGTLLLSSSANIELLRIAKANSDNREIAFENEGVDIGSIYFNSAEHMFIRQENSSLDLALRIGTTNAVRIAGSASSVGIYTDAPKSTLDINGSVSFNTTDINAGNDPGTTYTCSSTDHVILVNTRPQAQNGIDSTLTITLPVSSTAEGRVITVKDAGGYSDVNSITVQRQGSDTIDGIGTSVTIPNVGGWLTFIADGGSNWYQIG